MRKKKHRLVFSLSVKITIMLSAIIFVSVIGFSSFMITMTQRSLMQQHSESLQEALAILENAIATATHTDNAATHTDDTAIAEKTQKDIRVQNDALPYYILYKIISNDNETISTNDAAIPRLEKTSTKKAARIFVENYFTDGDLNLLYMAKSVTRKNPDASETSYHIQAALDLENDDLDLMLKRLPFMFALFALPLLAVSAVVGYFVCGRLLRPIKKITGAAKEISGEHLDRRLEESGANDELRELALTFNNLFARLEKDFEREKRFTSDAAHELKTPLAVITGYVDILSRWGKNDEKVLNDALAVLKRESASMATLVENLLALSRAENSLQVKYDKTQIKARLFLEQIRDGFAVVAPDVIFTIDCHDDAVLFTNEDALREILRILIQNSIAYSKPPADITLKFTEEKKDGAENVATLTVADKGVGIARENLPHIFDRFYRVDESRNRATGGNGLGLSIAKALAQKLDVTLTADSTLGKGTSMTITASHQMLNIKSS